MQTTVQPVSDVEVKVEVQIPADDVDREFRRQLAKVRKRARVKGFRPGKAPRDLVKRMYAEQLASDTATQLMTDTWSAALDAVERPKLGDPSFEPALAREGEPLRYGVRIQVKPEISLTAWRGIEVGVAPATLEEKVLAEELERLRLSQTERVPVDGRGADIGDVLEVDTHGTLDGEPDDRLHTHGMSIKLGDAGLIPGLADGLIGATAGQERDVTLTFPDDYEPATLAGRAATISVTIKQHLTEEVPDVDDDLAVDLGHADLAAMRASISADLQERADEGRSREAEHRILSVLLERHQFKAPPALVQAQFEHQARMFMMRLQMQGAPRESAIQFLESNRDAIVNQAVYQVRRYLALEALAAQEGVEVSDEVLDAEIATRLEGAAPNAEDRFSKPEQREGLRLELLERRALDLLLEHAVITDAAPEVDTTADVEDDAPEAAVDAATPDDDDQPEDP